MAVAVIIGTFRINIQQCRKGKAYPGRRILMRHAMGTAYMEAGSPGTVTTNKDLAAAFSGNFQTKLRTAEQTCRYSNPWGRSYA